MTTNYKKLVYEVVSRSESGDQDEAFSEWAEIETYSIDLKEGEEAWETCLCGKHPIFEVYLLENRKNRKKIKVGNVCITHFRDGDKMATILRDYKKVKNDIRKRLTQTSLDYMLDKKVPGFQNYKFYSARVSRKITTLTQAELDIITKVNQLFINFIERANLNRKIKTEPQELKKTRASNKTLPPKRYFDLQIYNLEEQRKMLQLIRGMKEDGSFYQILQSSPFYAEPTTVSPLWNWKDGVTKCILRAARLINLFAYIADEDPGLYEAMHKNIVRVRFNFTSFLSKFESIYSMTQGESLVDRRILKKFAEMLHVMQGAASQEECCDISPYMEEICRLITEEKGKTVDQGSLFDF